MPERTLPWCSATIYWVICIAEMARVFRDQWLSIAIGGASLVTLVWLEAFVW
ncbi:putative membrane protein [Synechococcus sp. A18-46.1]|nr:putative membrane protein [Synechococcus sp. A18-46.1]